MKTTQIDHEFHHKAQLPTSCDIFIFIDPFYKLTSPLSTNNCNKEEFKELTGNHKHWQWIEPWFQSTFISLIDLISQGEFNNRGVNRNTSEQSSRARARELSTWLEQAQKTLRFQKTSTKKFNASWPTVLLNHRAWSQKQQNVFPQTQITQLSSSGKTFLKYRMFKASIYNYLPFH